MPWVQRATTSLHRFSAIWSPHCGRRQITSFAFSYRPSSISAYPQTNYAFAALGLQLSHKLAIGRNALGRQNLSRRTPTCSDLPDAQTMASNSIRQSDIHADSTADSTDTPYSVVNFYHLLDIANPFQARQICLHSAECRDLSSLATVSDCIYANLAQAYCISFWHAGHSRTQAVGTRQGSSWPHLPVNTGNQCAIQRLDG